jgi:hypothetical protein
MIAFYRKVVWGLSVSPIIPKFTHDAIYYFKKEGNRMQEQASYQEIKKEQLPKEDEGISRIDEKDYIPRANVVAAVDRIFYISAVFVLMIALCVTPTVFNDKRLPEGWLTLSPCFIFFVSILLLKLYLNIAFSDSNSVPDIEQGNQKSHPEG